MGRTPGKRRLEARRVGCRGRALSQPRCTDVTGDSSKGPEGTCQTHREPPGAVSRRWERDQRGCCRAAWLSGQSAAQAKSPPAPKRHPRPPVREEGLAVPGRSWPLSCSAEGSQGRRRRRVGLRRRPCLAEGLRRQAGGDLGGRVLGLVQESRVTFLGEHPGGRSVETSTPVNETNTGWLFSPLSAYLSPTPSRDCRCRALVLGVTYGDPSLVGSRRGGFTADVTSVSSPPSFAPRLTRRRSAPTGLCPRTVARAPCRAAAVGCPLPRLLLVLV